MTKDNVIDLKKPEQFVDDPITDVDSQYPEGYSG